MISYPLLQVETIHTYYGDSHILFGVSLEVYLGEVVVLVGRHGAGKTTTLLSIMGIQPPLQGSILFNREEIAGLPSWKIAHRGIGLVPENRRVFPGLTVHENLEVGVKSISDGYSFDAAYANFPELAHLRHQQARNLSGGEQQMLTLARTLMGNPQLLLMDEPTEGLAPLLVQRTGEIIERLASGGQTILITGQNIPWALELASRVYILDTGTVKWSGEMQHLRSHPDILERYLAI
ncbi:MAG: ABC transporter ATP-binding protein [Prochloraceae cyanobacterium]